METVSNVVSNDSLEHLLLHDSITKDDNLEVTMCAQYLDLITNSALPSQGGNFES